MAGRMVWRKAEPTVATWVEMKATKRVERTDDMLVVETAVVKAFR